jgi:hypothetical protein
MSQLCPEYPDPDEGFVMTFQVALAASDGWVMASDTQETRFSGIASGAIRETLDTKKITYDSASDTTYMVSGDDIGRSAARQIVNALIAYKDEARYHNNEWYEETFVRLADSAWATSEAAKRPASPRKIILAPFNYKPLWEIWVDKESKAERMYSRVYSGDTTNPAKFFVEQYYKRELGESPPAARNLLGLVAHTVLMAGERNPSGVHGLEITFMEDGGLVVWDFGSPELRRLIAASERIDKYLLTHLTESFEA